jgi:hypothetical protein
MTGTSTLVARAALGIAGGLASFVAASSSRLRSGPASKFDRWIMAVYAASRLVLFAVVFLVLRIAPRGDIPSYYVPEALWTLAGRVQYHDFPSSYAPLHPYLDGAVLWVWRSPLAIILFAIVAEAALLWVWLRMGRLLLSEERLRVAALLYVASPISVQYVTLDGQDNVLLALLIATALWLAYKARESASGAVLGAGIAAVKFLPLVFVPGFLLGVKRWVRWALGFGTVIAAVYGTALLRGMRILYPLEAEGALKGSGNVPYVLESVSGRVFSAAAENAAVVLALLAVYACMLRPVRTRLIESRLRIVALGTVALTLALLLFAKKSWPPYLMLVLFPMCFAVVRPGWTRLRLALWCGFSAVAVLEHSYWASMMQQVQSMELHTWLSAARPDAYVLMVLELLLIAGYAWLLVDALTQIRVESANAKAKAPGTARLVQ